MTEADLEKLQSFVTVGEANAVAVSRAHQGLQAPCQVVGSFFKRKSPGRAEQGE